MMGHVSPTRLAELCRGDMAPKRELAVRRHLE